MIMLDDNMLNKEWVQRLSDAEFRLWISLLLMASKKTGIFESNMRTINFLANCSKKFTEEDLLTTFGNRIQRIPGHEDKMIIIGYIFSNWLKDNRVFDPVRNKLDRSIDKELCHYGLTIDKLNEMSTNKIIAAKPEPIAEDTPTMPQEAPESEPDGLSKSDADAMFEGFWDAYPATRKYAKSKCKAKFVKLLCDADDAVSLFNTIMNGLSTWKKSDDWTKDGGSYVCAPEVFINQSRWEAAPMKGMSGNGYKQNGGTANSNCKSEDTANLF